MISFPEVVEYIAGYDPAFPKSIAPATPDEISRLQSLVKGEFPEVYRDFLAVMGRSTGWINIQDIDFRISTVLEYYLRDDALPADDFLRIGSDTRDPSFNPHLTLYDFYPEMKVVAFAGCTAETLADVSTRYIKYLAGSLQELFCRPAFRIYEIFGPGRQPVALLAAQRVSSQLQELDQFLQQEYSFEPAAWSNDSAVGYAWPDLAIEAEQLGPYPLRILLRADDPNEQARIARMLADRFNLQTSIPRVD